MQVLRDIRLSEEEAERIRRSAAQKAREIAAAAEAEAQKRAREGAEAARLLHSQMMQQSADKARLAAQAQKAAHAAQLDKLQTQGRERLTIACDLIVGRIIGHGHR